MGVLKKTASVKQINNSEKKIVFIPMHHIGKESFYRDAMNKIDSLKHAGYTVYYEGLKFSRMNDSLKNDTLAMKLRKVIGLDMRAMKSNGGYIDTINNTVMGVKVKAVKRHHLVNQPRGYTMFDTTIDKRADVYLSDALNAFEEKYGPIALTDCDFNTKPKDKYKCNGYKGSGDKNFITLDYRNEFIVNEIIKDAHNKIVIVYGARHFKGVLEGLQKHDSTWRSY